MDDLDHHKETPEQRATRIWGNNDLTRRFLEEKNKPPLERSLKFTQLTAQKLMRRPNLNGSS
jgi:hypothetical protein